MTTQLQKLKELILKTEEEKSKIEQTLYYDDFLRAFKEVVAYVKDIEQRLSETNTSNKDSLIKELNDKATSILSDIETARKGLDTRFSTIENTINKDMLEFQGLFSELKDELKSEMPEEYDDEEMVQKVNELSLKLDSLKIPAEFDATELTQEIDQLKKDVDELKKRPMGGRGGQVTDKAVQYALMRSIQAVTPTGTIDGANDTFTVPSTIHSVLSFELNSRVVSLGTYSITGSARQTIVFDTPIDAAYSGKSFVITYI